MGTIDLDQLKVPLNSLNKYKDFILAVRKEKEPSTREERIYLKFMKYFEQEIKKRNVKNDDQRQIKNEMEM